MKNFEHCVSEAKMMLDKIGINYDKYAHVIINTRLTSSFGRTITTPMPHGLPPMHRIEISFRLLTDSYTYECLIDTILHELLHTVPRAHGHGGLWKQLADRVNMYYPKYHLGRVGTEQEYGSIGNSSEVKYVIGCNTCDHQWKYIKAGKTVRAFQYGYGSKFRCPYCNTYTLNLL